MSGKKSYSGMTDEWIDNPSEVLKEMQDAEHTHSDKWQPPPDGFFARNMPHVKAAARNALMVLIILVGSAAIRFVLYLAGTSLDILPQLVLLFLVAVLVFFIFRHFKRSAKNREAQQDIPSISEPPQHKVSTSESTKPDPNEQHSSDSTQLSIGLSYDELKKRTQERFAAENEKNNKDTSTTIKRQTETAPMSSGRKSSFWLAFVLLAGLITLGILCAILSTQLKNAYDERDKLISEVTAMEKQIDTLSEYAKIYETSGYLTSDNIFHYALLACSGNKSYKRATLESAVADGATPCESCRPGALSFPDPADDIKVTCLGDSYHAPNCLYLFNYSVTYGQESRDSLPQKTLSKCIRSGYHSCDMCDSRLQRKVNLFYVTPYGEKYHRITCQHIVGSDYRVLPKDDAEREGYEPCSVCNP